MNIIGQIIKQVRPMTDREMKDQYWEEDCNGKPMAIVLSNGVVIYPSSDYEGNSGGALFAKHNGKHYTIYVER